MGSGETRQDLLWRLHDMLQTEGMFSHHRLDERIKTLDGLMDAKGWEGVGDVFSMLDKDIKSLGSLMGWDKWIGWGGVEWGGVEWNGVGWDGMRWDEMR